MSRNCARGECEKQDLLETISVMDEAIEQALDDMQDGHSVCEQAKQMLIKALAKARR